MDILALPSLAPAFYWRGLFSRPARTVDRVHVKVPPPPPGLWRPKVKVCMVGGPAAEKTALIRPFVLDQTDDRWLSRLGTKVTKKVVPVGGAAKGGGLAFDMTIWDLTSEKGFFDLLTQAYAAGSQGILAVCDLSRRSTLDNLVDWIESVFRVAGRVPVVIVVNTRGFAVEPQFTDEEIRKVAERYGAPYFYVSPTTGLGGEAAFAALAERISRHRMRRRTNPWAN